MDTVATQDGSAVRGWGEHWAKHCLSLFAAGPSWSTTRSTWHLPALQRISTWSSTHLPQLLSTQLWVSQGHRGLSKDWIGDIWNLTLWESLGWELFSFIPSSWLLGAVGERSSAAIFFFRCIFSSLVLCPVPPTAFPLSLAPFCACRPCSLLSLLEVELEGGEQAQGKR